MMENAAGGDGFTLMRDGPMSAGRSIAAGKAEQLDEPLQIIIAIILDFDFSLFRGMLNGNVSREVLAEAVGDCADVDLHFAGRG